MNAEELAGRFRENSKVEAVALSGSRTSAINDSDSDYDIYIYCSGIVEKEERERIYSSLSLSYQVSISFFEEGDEASDGIALFDIMFRSVDWTEKEVSDVYRKGKARIGYTTCILHNIATSQILFDRTGWLGSIKREISSGYPEKLRQNIIHDNLMIIDGEFSSPFMHQAELAAKRSDTVSECHRLTAILASYFDMIFAYNRVYHPGEKKLIRYAHLLCKELPENFDDDIQNAIKALGEDRFIPALRSLSEHLHAFLSEGR